MTIEEKRAYNRAYQREWRAKLTPSQREAIRKQSREHKTTMRRTDAKWLKAERERRRRYGKKRTRDLAKYRQYAATYRTKEENLKKERARVLLGQAVRQGFIKVPNRCEMCNKIPKPFKTKRRPLRADHYMGYDLPLVVKFICVGCDGKQLRAKNKLVT